MKFTLVDMVEYFSLFKPGKGLLEYLRCISEMTVEDKEKELQRLLKVNCEPGSLKNDVQEILNFLHKEDNAKTILIALEDCQLC